MIITWNYYILQDKTPSVFYYGNYVFHNLIRFFCVKIARSYAWFLMNADKFFTDFYSFMTNYPTIIQHTWIPLLKINISDWPHFRHRTWMPHYLTRKCGAGLLICIRGSGKTRKQINENSTPHLYRMSFAYGYMWQVLLLSPASILKFTRFLIQGVSETHQLYMSVVCTTLQR